MPKISRKHYSNTRILFKYGSQTWLSFRFLGKLPMSQTFTLFLAPVSVNFVNRFALSSHEFRSQTLKLWNCKDGARGSDISFRNLQVRLNASGFLLSPFKIISVVGGFSHVWLKTYIVPILKLLKNWTSPNNHRPIFLTYNKCKLIERIFTLHSYELKNGLWFCHPRANIPVVTLFSWTNSELDLKIAMGAFHSSWRWRRGWWHCPYSKNSSCVSYSGFRIVHPNRIGSLRSSLSAICLDCEFNI